ncbi:MAG: tRNA pseudouridine(55) synthase TruB, partial [Polynucleobacter sp. 24-46-87]
MSVRIDGVVLLDKPAGLPICLGEATKYSQDLLEADKTYVAQVKFGQRTDTGDAEGLVIEELPLPVFAEDVALKLALDSLLPAFTGPVSQIPPMYSALKRDGKPLYEYARAGVELERAPRNITIHTIRWINVQWPEATLEVSCSKGTYIRVLAEDLGKALGCGAHLVGLRRTEVGHLTLEQSFTIESIQKGLQDSSSYI